MAACFEGVEILRVVLFGVKGESVVCTTTEQVDWRKHVGDQHTKSGTVTYGARTEYPNIQQRMAKKLI